MAKISPSLLSADFANLGRDVAEICKYGANYIHIDVMDGAFVPNISFGAGVMKSLLPYATVPFDVHLMVMDPERYIKDFITDNTEFVTVHVEACKDSAAVIDLIKSYGVKAGISISPETPVSAIDFLLDKVDLVLVMSVHPGFGGQNFIPEVLIKSEQLSKIRKERKLSYEIEMDGGINTENASLVKASGVDIIVAGSAVFKADDKKAVINFMR